MKISLYHEKYRKDIIDIVRIFSNIDPEFSQDGEISIYKDKAILDKEYSLSSGKDLKIVLYKYLSNKYGKSSPWGIMTGTKPKKLYNKVGPEGLAKDYLVDSSKIAMLESIDLIQKDIKYKKRNLSLYINIPFCPSRCTYCSFPTIVYTANDRREEYLMALLKEIDGMKESINRFNIRTIYIGGGTPTSFDTNQLEILMKHIHASIDLSNIEEFTFEAGREDTIDKDKLQLLKKYRVDRISINPQSFNEKVLEGLERNQDNERLKDLFYLAKEIGFTINMDLILGLKNETSDSLKETLDQINILRPHNLTIHTLSLKKGSKLVDRQESMDQEAKWVQDLLEQAQKYCDRNGYKPYYLYRQKEILGNLENVGYTLDGYKCLYNIITNEEMESILGIGMTSNSKIMVENKIQNYTNYKNLNLYIDNLDKSIEDKKALLSQVIF